MKNRVILLSILISITGSCCQTTTKENAEDAVIAVKSDEPLFDMQEIDSIMYFALKGETKIAETDREVITDLEQAKRVLHGRVVWAVCDEYREEYVYGADNPEATYTCCVKMRIDEQGDLFYYADNGYPFLAYYPQEDILVYQEHGYEPPKMYGMVNLTTGESEREAGEPAYIFYSPSKQYRLNGYYCGNGNSVYFIQKKTETQYQTLLEFPEFSYMSDLTDAFWQNDTTLNISITTNERDENTRYYQIILQ
jgi:hypothetical protein